MKTDQSNKTLSLPVCCSAALLFVRIALGQGSFQNLDFEAVTPPPNPSDMAVQIPATEALPGWTVYAGPYQQSEVWYNGISLGGALVSIIDRGTSSYSNYVIGGRFTATLDSGSIFVDGNQQLVSAAIAQTGTIPDGTRTLMFDASGDPSALHVTFDGQSLPFYALWDGPNFTTYGADISDLAGQTAELRFTEEPNPPPRVFTIAFLDNIQFIIPEPSSAGLVILGALCVGWLRWGKER